jgi:hypothetical protein
MKLFALWADFVTQVSDLFVATESNSLLAKLLSDALPRKARSLNLHPYRGLHVARYPMAPIPAEADCPLVLANRPARVGSGHDAISQ